MVSAGVGTAEVGFLPPDEGSKLCCVHVMLNMLVKCKIVLQSRSEEFLVRIVVIFLIQSVEGDGAVESGPRMVQGCNSPFAVAEDPPSRVMLILIRKRLYFVHCCVSPAECVLREESSDGYVCSNVASNRKWGRCSFFGPYHS